MGRDRRILVLGGGGRVGRLLGAVWRGNTRVMFQSRSNASRLDPKGAERLDDGALGFSPDVVFSLWGVTPHSRSRDLTDNTRLAIKANDIARQSGASRVVIASSAAVYPPSPLPHREEDVSDLPQTPYGQAKLAMEKSVLAAARQLGEQGDSPPVTVLRMANVMGADLLGDAAAAATPERPLELDSFPDGSGPRRSYLSAVTLARAVEIVGEADPTASEVLNLADGPEAWDMAEVLHAMERAGRAVDWVWRPAGAGAVARHHLDMSLLAERYPDLAAQACRSPDELVRDWLSLTGPNA